MTETLESSLLHSLSHDLRTPLAVITVALSNLETAALRGDLEACLNLARLGRQEVERLDRLVDNLLDLGRIEAGGLHVAATPCEVEELIGATLDRLAPEMDEDAAEPLAAGGLLEMDARWVLIEAPPGLTVPMDEALMVQALANVVDNATKYSPEGAQVDIIARVVGDQVEISVADRGPGLPAEELPRIFDKYYRVQRPEGVPGAGLGLTISKGIVEAHGGRIWAAKRAGGGMVVTLALPLNPLETAERG